MNAAAGVTWLFAPGNRPDRFDKASASGADHVIIDLEDAVPPEQKELAREHALQWLRGGGRAWVRINAAGSRWHQDDLSRLAGCRGLEGVVVPKAEDPQALEAAGDALGGVPLLALVESAVGVCSAHAVAASSAVTRLAFGALDFALDVGCDDSDHALLLARSTLVLASAAAGLPGPVDGVTTALDARETEADARRARGLGFAAKLCIHPAQLTAVREAFAPTAREIAWAKEVLAADVQAGAAKTADGHMVDAPVLARAHRLLASATTPSRR